MKSQIIPKIGMRVKNISELHPLSWTGTIVENIIFTEEEKALYKRVYNKELKQDYLSDYNPEDPCFYVQWDESILGTDRLARFYYPHPQPVNFRLVQPLNPLEEVCAEPKPNA